MNDRHPVVKRLRELEEARHTGTLTVRSDESDWEIALLDGRVEFITGGEEVDFLGHLLVSKGAVKKKAMAKLVRRVTPDQKLGQLVLRKRLTSPSVLRAVLEGQILERFRHILETETVKETTFQPGPPHSGLPLQLEVNHLLLASARNSGGKTGLEDQAFGLQMETLTELDQWPWHPEEAAVLTLLRQTPASLETLAHRLNRSNDRMSEVLGTLQKLALLRSAKLNGDQPDKSVLNSLGITPRVRAEFSPKVTASNQDAFISEQFRTLKVRLRMLQTDQQLKVITISSPAIQEGKSLVTTNLALSCAEDSERKVLLIDCDLRRPNVHSYLGIQRAPGVTDYLAQEGLNPHCFMKRLGNLYLMTGGHPVSNPVEVLSSDRMAKLLDQLREQFDLILVDSPPLEPIADTGVISSLADGLVLVIRSGKTSYASAERALRSLEEEKLLGIVLNDVEPLLFNTYYSRNYYYADSNPYYTRKLDEEDPEQP